MGWAFRQTRGVGILISRNPEEFKRYDDMDEGDLGSKMRGGIRSRHFRIRLRAPLPALTVTRSAGDGSANLPQRSTVLRFTSVFPPVWYV